MSTLDSLNNIRRYASCDSHGYMCESCPNDPEQVIKHVKVLMLDLIAQVTPEPSADLVHSHTDIVNYMLKLSQKVKEL